jgi:hypothetical protein
VETIPDLPGGAAPAPSPTATTAVLTLRNESGAAVTVSLEGPGSQTATVAPGVTLPLVLSAGSYELRASGDGVASPQSRMALSAERTYSVTITRRRDDGKESLALLEPA